MTNQNGLDLGGTFNAEDYNPDGGFPLIPAGWYPAQIIATELKQNSPASKDPQGQHYRLTVQLIGEHQYTGAQLFDQINYVNANATAERIARDTMSAIGYATGRLQIQNFAEFHNIPLSIEVGVRNSAQYGDQNDILKYKPLTYLNELQAQAPATPAAPAAAPAKEETAPPATPTPTIPAPSPAPGSESAASGQPWRK